MTTVLKHLTNLLKNSRDYLLTENDKTLILQKGLKTYLFTKFACKKFRKYKLDPAVVERIKFAIDKAVTYSRPIKVFYFQGGYKLWRLPSSPWPDWAEFFNLSYVISYLAPIAASYKPGVNLTYYCHTLLMEKHDNLTTEEINLYMNGLQQLMEEFSKYLPANFKLNILKDADIYTRKEYFAALKSGLDKALFEIKSWPKTKVKDYQRMAKLNIKWRGKADWTKLTNQEKRLKIRLASGYELAATSNLPKVMEKVKAPDLILLFTKSAPIFIGIGSTKTSIAKYWVGQGVLEQDERGFYERVLTPSQFEAVKNKPHKVVKINLIPGENFKEIWVYPRLNFS